MAYKLHTTSVLVVEDNLPMLNLTKSILQTFGIGNVYGAPDGNAGFRMFCQKRPDIVIADWMMSPVDGLELTHSIRTDETSPNKYVPIILMTSVSERDQVLAARDTGITEFLLKPFNARDLYRRLSEIIDRPRPFITSDSFFGPDRRRSTQNNYEGTSRRASDRDAKENKEFFDINMIPSNTSPHGKT